MVLWALLVWGTKAACDERPVVHGAWRGAVGSANGSRSRSEVGLSPSSGALLALSVWTGFAFLWHW